MNYSAKPTNGDRYMRAQQILIFEICIRGFRDVITYYLYSIIRLNKSLVDFQSFYS